MGPAPGFAGGTAVSLSCGSAGSPVWVLPTSVPEALLPGPWLLHPSQGHLHLQTDGVPSHISA